MRVDYPQLLAGALGAVLLVVLLVAAATSSAAFGVYNPAWDGAGQMRDLAEDGGANATVVLNTTMYRGVPTDRSVAVVLAPNQYGDAAAPVRRFVQQGGTLVVAEDFGAGGNALLRQVGADARFDGRLVRDERHYHRSPALPVATNVSETQLTANVSRLTLNYGTVVEPNGAAVLVATSEFAYLDTNRNGQLDDTESLGTYPVATVEQVGEGRVIAVSDPSLFVNAMLDREGDQQFAANLVAADHVLLGYSHAGAQPPLRVALLLVRDSPTLQGAVVAGLVLVVLGGRRLLGCEAAPGETSRQPDREAVARYLARDRGWDRDRVRRVTTGAWGRPSQGDDNE